MYTAQGERVRDTQELSFLYFDIDVVASVAWLSRPKLAAVVLTMP